MDVFSPSFGVFFWQLISFLLLLFLAKKFFLKKIVDTLQQRKKYIDDNLKQAKEAQIRKEKLERENEIATADLNKRKKEINEHMSSWQMQEKKNTEEKIKIYFQNCMNKVNTEIEQNKQRMLSSKKKEIINMIVNVTENLLKDKNILTQKNNILITSKMIDTLITKNTAHNSKSNSTW